MTRNRFWIFLLTITIGAGCVNEYESELAHPEESPPEQEASDKSSPSEASSEQEIAKGDPDAEAPKETTEAPVFLKIQNWDETYALRTKHPGKVIVMDLWSTSCPPCMKEFPKLVSLHRRFRNKGLVCISVSCDYSGRKSRPPEFYVERVTDFLTKQQATFDNILLSTDSTTVTDSIDLAAIPAVYVFDREGNVAKRFDNDSLEDGQMPFTYEDDVIPFVEGLLKTNSE